MGEFKGTPGPWFVHQSMQRIIFVEARSRELAIAKVSDNHPRSEDEANARLIAAAPELLEALQLVWDTYGMDPSVDSSIWQTVRAVISKATGSPQ